MDLSLLCHQLAFRTQQIGKTSEQIKPIRILRESLPKQAIDRHLVSAGVSVFRTVKL